MARFIVESGPDSGAYMTLDEVETTVIGRSSRCGVCLSDTLVSREHCRVQPVRGRWFIKNLKPSNGTLVNDVELAHGATQEIKQGDVIQTGNTRMLFATISEEVADPLLGSCIGEWRLEVKLGQTSSGSVYRAVHTKSGELAALKTLPLDISQDRTRRMRLMREARITAALQHPNIVHALEIGEQHGIPWMVLEFAPQGNLLDEIQLHTGLPLRRVVSLMMQLLPALERLEESELVHRDIKPENVFCFDDGVVKLGDFGLAASLTSAAETRSHLVGSPHYLSPELADGEPCDSRSDLYSLGAMLFHAIEGHPIYRGKNAHDTARMHGRAGAPLPAMKRPDLPDNLRAVIEGLLQKQPEKRYPGAGEALRAAKAVSASIARELQEQLGTDTRVESPTLPASTASAPLRSRATTLRRRNRR